MHRCEYRLSLVRTYAYRANNQSNLDRIHNMKLTSFKSNELICYTKLSAVGERRQKINGGWHQRLGIVKAFITKPKPLILDEATSYSDSQVENSITKSSNSLSENLTTIVVAHRLSTVRNSNVEVLLEDGKEPSTKSFEHEKYSSTNFFTSKAHGASNS